MSSLVHSSRGEGQEQGPLERQSQQQEVGMGTEGQNTSLSPSWGLKSSSPAVLVTKAVEVAALNGPDTPTN